MAEAIALFAPSGWAMCGNWHLAGTLQVLQQAGAGLTDEQLDEAITEMWNTDGAGLLKLAAIPIRRWSNAHKPFKQILWDRVTLIEKAIAHHFEGSYEASIPILLAQIDGMSRDLTGQSFFSKGNNDPYLDDETVAGMEINLPVVRALFSEDVRPTGTYGKLSRHGVLHGRDLGYATRVNSTKTIVLVAALAEYLPKVADDTGAGLRREHESQVAGSTATDEIGRLVDDRHVPEVHQVAWDVSSAYLDAVLFAPGPFDAALQVQNAAQKHGLDPHTFTVETDAIGWQWYYTLPSAQTLGYASRPGTSAQRTGPDIWRWDASRPPRTFPWSGEVEWRSDDEFPRSPNWEPKVVL
ncbi:hypothetical protein [Leucobacter ruminantium]|uniref:Uncharacterized protein n=1 Tax=Leucobacter ruminantium TaxID=1289170 RepID=A0A939LWF3_9MICO|nr:hypothetical protein [Leucobacter ruminantium]MBO1806029.1 hypothetical protein [Leucobacter ruminantium]